ncbi:MAG TPA: hypothetical protein VFL17_11765, partial [Anaerolineae bacterium]|nr:hypothetical protein [Anaerolineae bacterium]
MGNEPREAERTQSANGLQQALWLFIAATWLLAACAPPTPEPTSTPVPSPTPTSTPTITPTPTRVPREACPPPDPNAAWIAPQDFSGYPRAIGGFLNAGASADALRAILTNASSIGAQFGGVWPFDLTGDGAPETVVSIYDPLGEVYGPVPSGLLLVYGCVDRAAPLLHEDTGPPMPQVARIADLIGAGRGGEIATIHSMCGAHTCFDTLDVIGWDGAGFVSLMGDRLQMPYPTYTFVDLDGDPALEVQAVSGQIASAGAGPQRTATETWDWNGSQYVKVAGSISSPEYRIHVVHDADDLLLSGDVAGAISLYSRVITDDTLRDWLLEIGVEKPDDHANLTAYAWYRIMLAHTWSGDAASAQEAFDRLSADFPAGAPGHEYQELAQVFWSKYAE